MYYYLLFFIFGTLVGSFLNVVSLRYRPGQKLFDPKIIGGRSFCPLCRKKLVWYELIPILSFVLQRGRCRSCRKRLSFQYPLVEFLTGLIFVAVPWRLLSYESPVVNYQFLIGGAVVWISVFILFLLLSVIDLRHSVIPNELNLMLAILGVLLMLLVFTYDKFNPVDSVFLRYYALLLDLRKSVWLNHLLAAISGMAIFGAIIVLSKGRAMGWGDFKLVGALGLIFGWPEILLVLVLAFVIGAAISVGLLLRGKKTVKDAIPFGPFLVVSGTLVFFFGFEIVNSYFKLFKLM
jgi:prepilin signal peptidase PulO-like enzyme (type II secretory pathway)